MKNYLLQMDKDQLKENAYKDFSKLCGFNPEKKKHQRMMERAEAVLEEGEHSIDVKALISAYDGSYFKESKIVIDDIELTCDFFSQIPDEAVEGIYIYAVTAGECWFASEEEIMNFLYADNWGTVFVDEGERETFNFIKKDAAERFKNGKKFSKTMGPGYFGMPVQSTLKFREIIDFSSVGIRVKESGLMIPQKSCLGVYLLLNDETIEFPTECGSCIGNKGGCQFCKLNKNRG